MSNENSQETGQKCPESQNSTEEKPPKPKQSKVDNVFGNQNHLEVYISYKNFK